MKLSDNKIIELSNLILNFFNNNPHIRGRLKFIVGTNKDELVFNVIATLGTTNHSMPDIEDIEPIISAINDAENLGRYILIVKFALGDSTILDIKFKIEVNTSEIISRLMTIEYESESEVNRRILDFAKSISECIGSQVTEEVRKPGLFQLFSPSKNLMGTGADNISYSR